MQFNVIFETIFEYIHKKFRFVHTNTFCKYRKKLRASPRVHLVFKLKEIGKKGKHPERGDWDINGGGGGRRVIEFLLFKGIDIYSGEGVI